jgi:hypothetical protein
VSAGLALLALVALFLAAPLVVVLQLRGERGRWPWWRRAAFATVAIATQIGAQGAAAGAMRGSLFGVIGGAATVPVTLAFGGEEGSLAIPLLQMALFASLAAAWGAPVLALGVAAGFAIVPHPTLRLRRALWLLLVGTGVLMLAGAGGLAALAPVPAESPEAGLAGVPALAARVPWAPWPFLLVLLGGAMHPLFPTSSAADDSLAEPGWRW